MNKFIFTLLSLFFFNSYAQSYYEICFWEVETREGGLLYGMSETKDGADATMYEFQKENEGQEFDISDHAVVYNFSIFPSNIFNEKNPVHTFQEKANNEYVILTFNNLVEITKKTKEFPVFEYYIKLRDDQTNFVQDLVLDDNETYKSSEYLYTKTGKSSSSQSTYEAPIVNNETSSSYSDNNASNYEENTASQEPTSQNSYYVDNEYNDSANPEIVLWEVKTRAEGLLFGIATSKDEADAIMVDFQERNADGKYDISDYPAKYEVTESHDLSSVTKFQNLVGKPYLVISIDDIRSLEIIRSRGFDEAVDYYMDTRGGDRAFVTKRLAYMYSGLEKYRILNNSQFMANNK